MIQRHHSSCAIPIRQCGKCCRWIDVFLSPFPSEEPGRVALAHLLRRLHEFVLDAVEGGELLGV